MYLLLIVWPRRGDEGQRAVSEKPGSTTLPESRTRKTSQNNHQVLANNTNSPTMAMWESNGAGNRSLRVKAHALGDFVASHWCLQLGLTAGLQ